MKTSTNLFKWDKLQEYINNPYIISVISVLLITYSSFLAPNLPAPIASLFGNPLFKIIYLLLVLMVHKIKPIYSIILFIAFIISLQTLSRYQKITHHIQLRTLYQKPNDQERFQLNQEVNDEIHNHNHNHNHNHKTQEGLHPINQPQINTFIQDDKYLPNDPNHPARKMFADPNLNTAIYELNPPYAQKNLPNEFNETPNRPHINLPSGGPTRYSAYHGYTIS